MPGPLGTIRDIYQATLHHRNLDSTDLRSEVEAAPAFMAAGQSYEDNEGKPYRVQNKVAILSLAGILTKGVTFITRWFGGTSTRAFGADFFAALEDPGVSVILIYVDSPGGEVSGTAELAHQIAASRGKKDIVAYSDGLIASAAYWIAAAADRIYLSGGTKSRLDRNCHHARRYFGLRGDEGPEGFYHERWQIQGNRA